MTLQTLHTHSVSLHTVPSGGTSGVPRNVGEELLLRARLRRPAAVLQEEARARTRIRRRAAEDVQTRANARAAAIRMRG